LIESERGREPKDPLNEVYNDRRGILVEEKSLLKSGSNETILVDQGRNGPVLLGTYLAGEVEPLKDRGVSRKGDLRCQERKQ